MDLVGRYLAGEASAAEASRLEQLMFADEQLRKDFLAYARIDAFLPSIVSESASLVDFVQETETKKKIQSMDTCSSCPYLCTNLGLII